MNDWSSIGYNPGSVEDFKKLASMVHARGERINVPGGFYIKYTDGSGAELWAQADERGELCGMHPHFDCRTSMNVSVERAIQRQGFDGSFMCFAEPPMYKDSYSFVFDLPDFRAHSHLTLPFETEVSIAAFAQQIDLFDNDDEFSKSRYGKFARESYIASGLIFPDGRAKNPPEASAIVSGTVEAFEERMNSHSGRPFLWMRVKSLLGAMDVVCDPAGIKRRPCAGGIVCGSFWLSGRCRAVSAH